MAKDIWQEQTLVRGAVNKISLYYNLMQIIVVHVDVRIKQSVHLSPIPCIVIYR